MFVSKCAFDIEVWRYMRISSMYMSHTRLYRKKLLGGAVHNATCGRCGAVLLCNVYVVLCVCLCACTKVSRSRAAAEAVRAIAYRGALEDVVCSLD